MLRACSRCVCVRACVCLSEKKTILVSAPLCDCLREVGEERGWQERNEMQSQRKQIKSTCLPKPFAFSLPQLAQRKHLGPKKPQHGFARKCIRHTYTFFAALPLARAPSPFASHQRCRICRIHLALKQQEVSCRPPATAATPKKPATSTMASAPRTGIV